MPDFVNVSKFGPRPGTPAAGLTQLPADIVKERSNTTSRLVSELALTTNKKWVDWSGEAVVTAPSKERGQWIARNFAYKPIIINKRGPLLGKTLKVKILDATPAALVGWPVKS